MSLPLPASLPSVDAQGKIFIGAATQMMCLSAADDSTLWDFPVSAPVTTQPAISKDGRVYVGTSDGKIYAF